GRPRRGDRRHVREPRAGCGRQLVALFARRSDHRRHGVTGWCCDRVAPPRPDHELRRRLPPGELHLLLDHLHVRARRARPRGTAARALREACMRHATPDRVVGLIALVLAVLAPFYVSSYWVGTLLTQVLFLGIVAASLIFLSA